ncbi:MAG: haloacid dehalogenase, partial [Candidatus Methanomethylophilus sp.]|nr:haloacid dehalogenase [Methanomethylophilus sp.]
MGKHLTAAMLYYMFDSANMHRWNDHYRTIDLTELDKQAHKAAIAWYLGKCEERAGRPVDWRTLIEHQLFAFIHRIAITDLKPPVYYELIKKEDNRRAINEYAYSVFQDRVPQMDEGFRERFRKYICEGSSLREDYILGAAHYLATRYEFELIKDVNSSVIDIEETR